MADKALRLGFLSAVLLVAALAFRKSDLAWMALIFLAYLGAGLVQAPAEEDIRLGSSRRAKKLKRGRAIIVEVELTLRNEGTRPLCVEVVDPVRRRMRVLEGSPSFHTLLRPGEEAAMRYLFEAERGLYGWGEVRAIASDPFELFETRVTVDAGSLVLVPPRLERMRPVAFRPRNALSSPGSVPTRMGGGGTDFWGVRDYQSGDPLRQLDWRLAARHPYRFFTREFVLEKTAEITLILDGRALSELRASGASLFEAEARAAASMAEMLLRQGHRVGLIVIGERNLRVHPDYGKLQLNRILNCLAQAEVSSNRSQGFLNRLPLGRIAQKSLLVVISPADMEEAADFRRLRAQGFEVALVCPDALEFAAPLLPKDRAGALALRAAALERRIRLSRIAQLSVAVLDWRIGEPLQPLLRNKLGRAPRGRK